MPKIVVSRRGLLELGLGVAASSALPAGAAVAGPQAGDVLVAVDDGTHAALRLDDLPVGGAPMRAWPMDRSGLVRSDARFNQVLLLRLPDVAGKDGAVAFSAICTHAGCVVSGWSMSTRLLHCPCHGSEYDPAHGGAVVTGPAPLPLPALPVRVTDGIITISASFATSIGGHTGRTD